MNSNDIKWEKIFNKYNKKAEKIFKDKHKISKLLEDTIIKLNQNKGELGEVVEKIKLLFCMLKDYFKGDYKVVPKSTIITIIIALIYFITPVDIIPDILPIAGFFDDAVVIGIVLKRISLDIENYKKWRIAKRSGKKEDYVDVKYEVVDDNDNNE